MKILKFNKLSSKFLLVLLGIGYFSLFTQLDINPFWQNYVAIIPFQILALTYFLYRYFKDQ